MRPIDADALVEQLSNKAKEMLGIAEQCKGLAINYYTGAKYGFAKAAIIANSMQSAEKHGKWLNRQKYNGYLEPINAWHHRCSECGFYIISANERNGWDYCPNCGARMERSEE